MLTKRRLGTRFLPTVLAHRTSRCVGHRCLPRCRRTFSWMPRASRRAASASVCSTLMKAEARSIAHAASRETAAKMQAAFAPVGGSQSFRGWPRPHARDGASSRARACRTRWRIVAAPISESPPMRRSISGDAEGPFRPVIRKRVDHLQATIFFFFSHRLGDACGDLVRHQPVDFK
jgi:hypothetical protein